MNQLQPVNNQTPIEIALGIDENGMTTAKNLYDFLELDKKNYARWCKSNIIENEFADGNKDYFTFVIDEERKFNPNPTQDYKLTASFAKKLSMTAKNEKGEQARNYFVKAEDKLKEVVLNIEGLSKEMQALIMHDKKIQAVVEHINKYDNRLDNLENTMVIDYGQQRVLEKLVNWTVITALGGKESNAYKEIGKKVFSECNRDIKDHFDVNSRNNIPKLRFDEACTYIKKWQPCTNTRILIEDINAQINIA